MSTYIEELLLAIERGEANDVSSLLKVHPGVSQLFKDQNSERVLQAALSNNKWNIAVILINRLCWNRVYKANCKTALEKAVGQNNRKMVKLFLDKVFSKSQSKNKLSLDDLKPAWMKAIKPYNESMVTLLLDHIFSEHEVDLASSNPALMFAIEQKNEEMVNLLSVDIFSDDQLALTNGEAALRLAIKEEDEKMVELLLDNIFSRYRVSLTESTPTLVVAILHNTKELVKLLLDDELYQGEQNKEEMIEFFLEHVFSEDQPSFDSLEVPSYQGQDKTVEILLNRGARLRDLEYILPISDLGEGDEEAFCELLSSAILHSGDAVIVELVLEAGLEIPVYQDGLALLLLLYSIMRQWDQTPGPSESEYSNCLKVIVRHILWGLSRNRYMRGEKGLQTNPLLNKLKMECEEEFEQMRDYTLGETDVTLFDIWSSTDLQFYKYFLNQDINDSLINVELYSQFPVTGRIVKHVRKALKRKSCLKKVCNFFPSLSARNQLPRLPATCIREIFDLLNTKDLINLRKAYYP